jgi:hypothetical protein
VKLVQTEVLISSGEFAESDEWRTIQEEIGVAISSVAWPPGAKDFTIHAQSGRKRGEGSGVKPIKEAFQFALQKRFGWALEHRMPLVSGVRPGPIDAMKMTSFGPFGVEWETGNISSSHRSLNRLALGMLQGNLAGGTLVLPTRELYQYLTDRVGNYREIAPYFPLWKKFCDERGVLTVVAVEHDRASVDVPRISKGTDGRALV